MTPQKKKREPLTIGARVRVKDLDQTDGRACSDTGRVVAVSSDGVKVVFDNWQNHTDPDGEKGMWFFPRQVRRLLPRAKPEQRKPVERWIYCDRTVGVECDTQAFTERPEDIPFHSTIRLCEVPPGSVVLSREELERAWDSEIVGKHPCYYPMISKASEPFGRFAKALFPEAKEPTHD